MKKYFLLILILSLAFILRIYRLDKVPPSLYWDETSLGYNAYAISHNLIDEHGEFLPLTRFIAFGDYKAPGYIYTAAASIKLLGLTEFAIRFPSALAGTLLVLLTIFLVQELYRNDKLLPSYNIVTISYLAGLFVAISPWSLQLSRGAFEANLATLFSGFGTYLFLSVVQKKSTVRYLLAALSFALSMYTFNSHRIFVPLIILALTVIFRQQVLQHWKKFLVLVLALVILLLPLGQYGLTREAKLRFDEVAWVNDIDPLKLANDRVSLDGNTWWSKIIHNRRLVYTGEFLKHYADFFQPGYLFYSGDANPRLSIRSVGELYWIDLPFFLAGLYFLVITWRKTSSKVLLVWLFLAPVPAALARETPHALRSLNILPVPQIIVAVGLAVLLKSLKFPKFLKPLMLILYLLSFIFYLRSYYFVYPVKYASSWQYGYKQAVSYVSSMESRYPCVNVTEKYGRPYIYFLLYNHVNPESYLSTVQKDRDWYGFWTVHGFGKYHFGNSDFSQPCLYVQAPNEVPARAKILSTVNDLNNQPVFEVFTKK